MTSLFDSVGPAIAAHAAASRGLSGDALVIAVAIAGAESSFNPGAIGDKDRPAKGCASYGFWQINVCPNRDANDPARQADGLLDPLRNATSMVAISSGGTNWQPWTTYNEGQYRSYIPAAQRAIDKLKPDVVAKWAALTELPRGKSGPSISTPFGDLSLGDVTGAVTGAVGAITDPIETIAGLFRALLKPETWLRIVGAVVGLGLTINGLLIISRDLGV